MNRRLPIILSVTALVVAVAGITPLGEAARDATEVVRFARNADKVDGIHASRSPKAGRLLALNSAKKFPASVHVGSQRSRDSRARERPGLGHAQGPRPQLPGREAPGRKRASRDRRWRRRDRGDGVYPSSPSQWTIRAVEQNAVASWALTGYVFCVAGT